MTLPDIHVPACCTPCSRGWAAAGIYAPYGMPSTRCTAVAGHCRCFAAVCHAATEECSSRGSWRTPASRNATQQLSVGPEHCAKIAAIADGFAAAILSVAPLLVRCAAMRRRRGDKILTQHCLCRTLSCLCRQLSRRPPCCSQSEQVPQHVSPLLCTTLAAEHSPSGLRNGDNQPTNQESKQAATVRSTAFQSAAPCLVLCALHVRSWRCSSRTWSRGHPRRRRRHHGLHASRQRREGDHARWERSRQEIKNLCSLKASSN